VLYDVYYSFADPSEQGRLGIPRYTLQLLSLQL